MKHLSYSNVMATIAVFIALGGTSYAAVRITGDDVRNSSLTGADIKNRSLTGLDVKNGSLTGTDVENGSISAKELREGTLPVTRWLLLNESGDIEEQSGGFTVVSKPGVNGQPATNPNIYVDAGDSLVGKGLTATIAIQNRLDRDANGTPDPAFRGDVAVGRCNTAAIMCVPTGTNVDNVLVVRALADNTSAASQTRRAFVHVTP